MTQNAPSFIAGLLITLSVLMGAQIQGKKTANNNSAFFDFQKTSQSAQQKNSDNTLFSLFNQNALNAAANLQTGLSSVLSKFLPYQPPQPKEIPLQKLPALENIPAPDFNIKAGVTINDEGKILYQKNQNEQLPIASITKLMTALVAVDELSPNETLIISQKAVDTDGDMGGLVVNEKLTAKDALSIMLIDSSNDAAVALAEAVEQKGENFVDLMNNKAVKLQLNNSHFSDPSGLDPSNLSSAYDLAVLMNNCLMNPSIQKILETEKTDINSLDGKVIHHLVNTNKLLNGDGIVAGKTGYTEEAGECLITVVKLPEGNKYFISVVLGAEIGMRFIETERLVKWTKKVVEW